MADNQKQKKANQALILERRRRVMAGLLAGFSYRSIAARLDISIATISRDVKELFKEMEHDRVNDVAQYRKLELQRIDVALAAIWGKIAAGHLGEIDRLISLQNQRAKYVPGLQDPERKEFTGKDGQDLPVAQTVIYMPDNGRPDRT